MDNQKDITGDHIQRLCTNLALLTRLARPGLDVNFIPFHSGQRAETLGLFVTEHQDDPQGINIAELCRNAPKGDKISFLGLCIRPKKGLFGFGRKEEKLGLIALNTDISLTRSDLEADLFHELWYVLYYAHLRDLPEYKYRFHSGIMIPNHTGHTKFITSVKADVFSALLGHMFGDRDAPETLSKKRAQQVLQPSRDPASDIGAYPLVHEATQYAIREYIRIVPPPEKQIDMAWRLAEQIGKTITERAAHEWRAFCTPAQDMAWRGASPPLIVAAAIHTSPDPFIRSLGYLLSEQTGLPDDQTDVLKISYNSFMDLQKHLPIHDRQADKSFSDAVEKGISANSSRPFLEIANEQNRSLLEGKFLGWCAQALQAAAKAFEDALGGSHADGIAPLHAAQIEFEKNRKTAPLDSLHALSNAVQDKRRQGESLSLEDLPALCPGSMEGTIIAESITHTLEAPYSVIGPGPFVKPAAPAAAQPGAARPAAAPSGAEGPPPPLPPVGPQLGKSTPTEHLRKQQQAQNEHGRKEGKE